VDGGVMHPLMSRDVQRARLLADGYAKPPAAGPA
jgi:hypothetical protein